MGKSICWIDDYSGAVMTIAENIFSYFWKLDKEDEEGIETQIRLVGNGFQEPPGSSLWSNQEENDLQEVLIEHFGRLCSNVDEFLNKGIYEKKIHLVYDQVKILYKASENGEEDEEIREYRALCRIWQGNPLEEGEITEEAKNYAKKLYERLEIKKGACVALDLALLQGDIEKVRNKNLPILSMELYNLVKKEHECFLYSYYVFDNAFIKQWKETYVNFYKDMNTPVIHRRNEMYTKKITDKFINQLLELIDKSYERGENLHD